MPVTKRGRSQQISDAPTQWCTYCASNLTGDSQELNKVAKLATLFISISPKTVGPWVKQKIHTALIKFVPLKLICVNALTFLQSTCQLHAPSKLTTSVALYCEIKLHILEWPFIVASLRHTCGIIMVSNQHLDMPHLWGGWIISAKEKCSLTQIYTDLWTIFERNRPFVFIEKS